MSVQPPRTLSPRACEFPDCGTTNGNLLCCSACQIVYYCEASHQAADQGRHKTPCNDLEKARKALEKEEKALRDRPGDMFSPPNLFENAVGRFWGIIYTRDYMRARYHMVDTMLKAFGGPGGRINAVEQALDNFLDMLRLNRSDNMGIRDLVPALYIRLNRDQAAYDFLKWYATTGNESDYDWGDMSLPFLDVKDSDVLESPLKVWTDSLFLNLSHVVAVLLIKISILLDLQAVQNATRALNGSIPPEIIELIRSQLVGSILVSRPDILLSSTEELGILIQKVKGHVISLYRAIKTYNPQFWHMMLSDPYAAAEQRPSGYSARTGEEACVVIGYCLASWEETPGAYDIIETLSMAV